MKTGDIVLIPFPFSDLTNTKIRPAVVVCVTKDKFKDIVVCAISSVVPAKLSVNEILLRPNSINQLRAISVLKVDRIVTLKSKDKVANLGKLSSSELKAFKEIFFQLVR